jgi:hypothetical protein
VDVAASPKPALIEANYFIERVVSAAMGVARVIRDLPQLPEHRHVDRRTQRGLQLLDGGDPLPPQQRDDAVCVKLNWAHSVRPLALSLKSNISATDTPTPLRLHRRVSWPVFTGPDTPNRRTSLLTDRGSSV